MTNQVQALQNEMAKIEAQQDTMHAMDYEMTMIDLALEIREAMKANKALVENNRSRFANKFCFTRTEQNNIKAIVQLLDAELVVVNAEIEKIEARLVEYKLGIY